MSAGRTWIVAVFAIFWCSAGIAADSEPPPDPDLGTNIVTAAAVDGQLFVLGSPRQSSDHGGAVVSFDLASGERHLRFANNVTDLERIGGHLVALQFDGNGTMLLEWNGRDFTTLPPLPHGDAPQRLVAAGNEVGVLAGSLVYVLDKTGWHSLGVRQPPPKIPAGAFRAEDVAPVFDANGMPSSRASLYSGFNQGEWGGGFDRRDLATGEVKGLEDHTPTGAFDRSIYDSGLDPVNAIIADPAHPDCVIAAVGLIHFEASGRLLRACADALSIVLEPMQTTTSASGKPFTVETEAFFNLVPARDGYWAVSNAAVYRFAVAQAQPQRFVLTHFEPWHGLWINREAPGALVLITEVNRRFSVNSGTPLVVPLD